MKAVPKKNKKIHYYLSDFHAFLLLIHLIFIFFLYWKTLFSSSVFTLFSFSLPFFLKSISPASILVLPEPVFVILLKVHKIEILFGFYFEICIISLLVM